MWFMNNSIQVGKYELGKTLGKGTFSKVKMARNIENGAIVAIKVMDKKMIHKYNTIEKIQREISTMKLLSHPSIVKLLEVIASETKIYLVLEYVPGGELLNKIKIQTRLTEEEARKYFQQLIDGVDYFHNKNVYHRDLKPNNLLIDANGNLKIVDFGISALNQQYGSDCLFHTMCGTPSYIAPEIINGKGYDGALADLWSCGIILFMLMAGYVPFQGHSVALFKKILQGKVTYPTWFSPSAKQLITRILDPNPKTRITIVQIRKDEWFQKEYTSPQKLEKNGGINLNNHSS